MKPARSREYLRWIRAMNCIVCNASRRIEASHTGTHGLGQKASDFSAIPLCEFCHRVGPGSYHADAKGFMLRNPVQEWIRELNEAYSKQATKGRL